MQCTDDPVTHLSSAPSSRSLATPTQLFRKATFSTVSRSSENLRREWGGHRDPMSLPPLPYHVLFLVFLLAVLFAANQQKESVGRAKMEEILRAKD